jgi:hypothetical protein
MPAVSHSITGFKIQNLIFPSDPHSVHGFNSLNTYKNILVAQNYTNLTPTVNFQYTFSKTKHLRFNYNGRPGTPTVTQLQPLITRPTRSITRRETRL